MKQKLNAKDFILIGVLTALMWIICMIISTIMSVAGPVTNVFYPSVVAIPNGIVMMLLLAKVPKKGVFTICSAIQAILFLLVGAFWFIPIGLVIGGVICDFLVMGRKEITMKSMTVAYALFSAIFAFSAICPIKFLQSAFVGAMEKNNIAQEVHRRDAEYHLRPHAGGHRCGRFGGWPDRRRDWAEGFEEALYKSRARFSQITRHSPSAVNQTNAGKRAA